MRTPQVHQRLTGQRQRLRASIADVFAEQCARREITPVPVADLAALLLAGDPGLAQLALTNTGLAPTELYGHLVGLIRDSAIHGWKEGPRQRPPS